MSFEYIWQVLCKNCGRVEHTEKELNALGVENPYNRHWSERTLLYRYTCDRCGKQNNSSDDHVPDKWFSIRCSDPEWVPRHFCPDCYAKDRW